MLAGLSHKWLNGVSLLLQAARFSAKCRRYVRIYRSHMPDFGSEKSCHVFMATAESEVLSWP